MTDDYRQRCADAAMNAWSMHAVVCDHSQTVPVGNLVDAVLAVRDDELRAVESVIDDLTRLVRDLAYPDPCDYFDHHGHCQTHGWTNDDRPCPHARARDILAAQEAGESRG